MKPLALFGGRAPNLERVHRDAGLPVEIETGPIGIVVYGPSSSVVWRCAKGLLATVQERDPRGEIEAVDQDHDEPIATRWHAVVRFEWSRLEEGVA